MLGWCGGSVSAAWGLPLRYRLKYVLINALGLCPFVNVLVFVLVDELVFILTDVLDLVLVQVLWYVTVNATVCVSLNEHFSL